MEASFTQAEFDNEYARFSRSPEWELRNIRKALNILPFFNNSEDWARLAAVKAILKERRK